VVAGHPGDRVASFHHAADGIVTTAIERPRFSAIASSLAVLR
jgi:hypothetical protein